MKAVLAYSITIGLSASTGKRLREVQLVDNAFEGYPPFNSSKKNGYSSALGLWCPEWNPLQIFL